MEIPKNPPLEAALKSVSDSYYDFVYGIMIFAGDDKALSDKLIRFIKENPGANSSEVSIKFNELRGIFPIT